MKKERTTSESTAAAADSTTADDKNEPAEGSENPESKADTAAAAQTDNDDNNTTTDDNDDAAYAEYKNTYCLNFVHAFFNLHMDDSWFRVRYSPRARQLWLRQEQQRAMDEATAISEAVQASIADQQQQQEEGKDDDGNSSSRPLQFVEQACLGKGTKMGGPNNSGSIPPLSYRKRKASDAGEEQGPPPPASHVLRLPPTGKKVLTISEVPPWVNEDQLLSAFMEHCDAKNVDPRTIAMYSSTPVLSSRNLPLERTVFMVADAALVGEISKKLSQNISAAASTPRGTVPRKDDGSSGPNVWELEVECRDAYGRAEYDHDNKGGAPADGLAVPPRKEVVFVSEMQALKTKVKTLSAALSSKERIPKDREAALTIAKALDTAWKIPDEHRLDNLLDRMGLTEPEQCLDVTIAYLRRVHLFSFYNSCAKANCIGDVLVGKHAATTVYLRLENADEILKDNEDPPAPATEATKEAEADAKAGGNDEAKPDSTDEPAATPAPAPAAAKDMLVQRLDDGIARALEASSKWQTIGINDADMEQNASSIVEAEQAAEQNWLLNHSLDDEGRARCSFHFCRKLFKDKTFLHKHLLKKHREYLKAEQAKVHDSYMMKAWDEEDRRMVPRIQIDCGQKFGLQPILVTGRKPTCEDPEPGLWKQEEERMAQEDALRQRKDEMRAQRREARIELGDSGPAPRPSGGFVDVDDMKEEKVEVSFEDMVVDVPVVTKKKKKKRKLL